MKKLFLILVGLTIFWGCNRTPKYSVINSNKLPPTSKMIFFKGGGGYCVSEYRGNPNDQFVQLSNNIGHLLETKDGGANWREVQVPFSDIKTFYFFDQNNGWACGLYSPPDSSKLGYRLFHTSDGCKNWEMVSDGWDANDIYFSEPLVGWIVGDRGLFASTIDGGKSWVNPTIQINDEYRSADYQKITFLDSERGCVVGNNEQIYLTEDGGKNWIPQKHPGGSNGVLYAGADVAISNKNNIWVVIYGELIHYDGSKWDILTMNDLEKIGLFNRCDPTRFGFDPRNVCFSGSDEGWLICSRGCIFYTHNGEKKWKQIPAKINESKAEFCQDPDSKDISYISIFQSPNEYTYIYGYNPGNLSIGNLKSVLLKFD